MQSDLIQSDIQQIYTKINVNFNKSILTKDELKLLYWYTYDKTRHNTKGLSFQNLSKEICYTISSFNLISRLQYILYDEINRLQDINAICIKIQNDECLTPEEANMYNKYLILQTFIEIHDSDLLLKINEKYKYVELKNDLYDIPRIRIQYIRKRLEQYVFLEKEDLDLLDIFEINIINLLKDIDEELPSLSFFLNGWFNDYKIYNKSNEMLTYSFNLHQIRNNYDEYRSRLIEIKDYLDNMLIIINDYNNIYYIIDPYNIRQLNPDHLQENTGEDYENINIEKIKELKEQVLTMNIFPVDNIKQFNSDYNDEDETTYYIIKEYLKDKFTKIYGYIKNLYEYINKYMENTLQMSDFSVSTCSQKFLRLIPENLQLLQYAFSLFGFNLGLSSIITIKRILNILSSRDINIYEPKMDEPLNTNPESYEKYRIYMFSGQKSIKEFIENKAFYDIPGYTIVGFTLNCSGTHSISALCYGDNCEKNIFKVINDMQELDVNIDNPDTKYGTDYSECTDTSKILIETILYEHNSVVIELQKSIKQDIDKYIKQKRVGDIQITYPQIHGGKQNELYYKKYLKYKTKYINLKNNF